MPETFSLLLPAEAFLVTDAQIWKPLRFDYTQAPARNFTLFTVFGRLKPGVTFAQAQSEMDEIARQLRKEHSIHESSDMRIRVVPLQHDIVKHAQPALWALLGAVGFVLLIACANVAHLLLARATARQHEMALRSALGAGGLRLLGQLATESLLLAAGGGIIGLMLAEGGLTLLRSMDPANLPRMSAIRIDGTVLAFALGITAVNAIVFGIVPALRAAGRPQSHSSRQQVAVADRDSAASPQRTRRRRSRSCAGSPDRSGLDDAELHTPAAGAARIRLRTCADVPSRAAARGSSVARVAAGISQRPRGRAARRCGRDVCRVHVAVAPDWQRRAAAVRLQRGNGTELGERDGRSPQRLP